jgi:hypothetical protein
LKYPGPLIGEMAFDAGAFLATLTKRHITPVLTFSPKRTIAPAISRSTVGAISNKLKYFRALARCSDKLARNFLAGIHLAAAIHPAQPADRP